MCLVRCRRPQPISGVTESGPSDDRILSLLLDRGRNLRRLLQQRYLLLRRRGLLRAALKIEVWRSSSWFIALKMCLNTNSFQHSEIETHQLAYIKIKQPMSYYILCFGDTKICFAIHRSRDYHNTKNKKYIQTSNVQIKSAQKHELG